MDKFKFLLVGSGNIASTYIKAAANVPEIAITGIVSRSGRRPAGADEKLPVYYQKNPYPRLRSHHHRTGLRV